MTNSTQAFALAVTVPCVLFMVAMVRRRQMRAKYAMVWIPVALGMVSFSVVPGLADKSASLVGVSYAPAMLFAMAIALLMMVSVHYSWELSRLEERVRVLAETIALADATTHTPVMLESRSEANELDPENKQQTTR